jgi:hypothetical protein
MGHNRELLVIDRVSTQILVLRGQRVILDRDLANLYGVTTGAFNRAVKRNVERFPDDFMFQLTRQEQLGLATAYAHLDKLKFSKSAPFAFTEHGALMAASILNSPRAVEASIFVVRAFVRLREFLATHKELAQKLAQLERKLGDHDEAIADIMRAIRHLMNPPPGPTKPKIGFR